MITKTAFKLAAKAQPSVFAAQLAASAAPPLTLADVALIDAGTCAAAGDMSKSWWLAEVAAERAPKPVVQRPRCTRWRLKDVRAFWIAFADAGQLDPAPGMAMRIKAAKASAKAREKRHQAAEPVTSMQAAAGQEVAA